MLLCARGAILRSPRLNLLRLTSRVTPRSPTLTLVSRSPVATQINVIPILRSQCCAFSTTRYRSEQTSVDPVTEVLPVCCPGCGAFSQTVEADEPGYYSTSRKQTRKLLAASKKLPEPDNNDIVEVHDNDNVVGSEPPRPIQGKKPGLVGARHWLIEHKDGAFPNNAIEPVSDFLGSSKRVTHVCDRCHDLIHHNKAVASPKPTILSIRNYLEESPYKWNRVYHIIDAADFPMSLVPRIHWALSLQQRSQNRRATHDKYSRGNKLPTISFIITRSDLLAATKEQVDSKMEYIRTELRAALGRTGKDARLGGVHMISAHRGWWTKDVKEEIRDHGGGIWVVGKANVGKSSFIEACFPKDTKSLEKIEEYIGSRREEEIPNKRQASLDDPNSLLPPAPQEDLYPVLPVVSSLPGTTVSPIRIPFGRGRGEVIDLPGLERGLLEDYVKDEHKRDLIMTKRIKPDRSTIKPGQSLLLGGGLIRITPTNPQDTVMVASFLPIESHITNTQKAIETQAEERPYRGIVLMKEGTGSTMASAGKFDIKWDVTRSHLPTSLAKAVADKGIPIPSLPYRVMSADILVEGCGWIELSIQIRSKRGAEDEASYPRVEVFTPKGKHIGIRRPMECWQFIADKHKKDKRKLPRTRRQ
ncbi:hypothetical protein N7508_010855 [Penicillium antarcticum]|uniref:uncharacterized protein n=1 Tax=Penicillium antarcticum TaxID=416450 RepID=UPI0023867277|nr:uncharacterized protein N7508_010855 [Penicillium antarcticum]KAJ5296034.1 hypothetical protein N7508_010855 [Penicillium antarcticum]